MKITTDEIGQAAAVLLQLAEGINAGSLRPEPPGDMAFTANELLAHCQFFQDDSVVFRDDSVTRP